jgi:hypothetical protein
VLEETGSGSLFSKGILAVSLMGAGLEPDEAHEAAREIEARLLRQGLPKIDRTELRDLVAETLERTHGAGPASRYRIWRTARDDGAEPGAARRRDRLGRPRSRSRWPAGSRSRAGSAPTRSARSCG